jgi:hypothetical protein
MPLNRFEPAVGRSTGRSASGLFTKGEHVSALEMQHGLNPWASPGAKGVADGRSGHLDVISPVSAWVRPGVMNARPYPLTAATR